MDYAFAGAAGGLGCVCGRICRFGAVGDAGGCGSGTLCLSGSPALVVLCAAGFAGIDAGQYPALLGGLRRRRDRFAQADFGGAFFADSPLV